VVPLDHSRVTDHVPQMCEELGTMPEVPATPFIAACGTGECTVSIESWVTNVLGAFRRQDTSGIIDSRVRVTGASVNGIAEEAHPPCR